MKNEALLKKVGIMGYPLLEKDEDVDANATLAQAVTSHNLRLWEGFPLLLANAAKDGLFEYEKVKVQLKKQAEKKCLDQLLIMSLALYKTLDLVFFWVNDVSKNLAQYQKAFNSYLGKFKNKDELTVCGMRLSPQRLKNTFSNYFHKEEAKLKDFVTMKEGFDLEYALSQVFSPKQKELFFKKLKGEKLSKTEREYYSRTVKKKVAALANPELHRLAQKII
ncbi:MAG: hypothetical protein Q8L26_06285 [Candidatus Omnitrophota bacterium]|nr:hypothetical protein [Candidatus Omnitrophota bacterium]